MKFVTPSTTVALVASLILQSMCSAFQLPEGLEVKQESVAQGQLLMQGMIAARELIRSAECSVESRHERIPLEKCQYQCLFDHKQDLLRFEHFSDQHERTVFVRTPTEAFQYVELSGTIELLNPKSAIALHRAEPFDPRAIGIQGYGGFVSRRRWEDSRADLSKLSVRDVQADPQDAGLTVLTLESQIAELKRKAGNSLLVKSLYKYWIDEKQGFRVPRYEMTIRLCDDPARQKWQPERVQEAMTTEWREEGGLQLPEKCVLINGPNGKTLRLTLSIHWAAVNRPMDRTRFTSESLQVKPGTITLDRR